MEITEGQTEVSGVTEATSSESQPAQADDGGSQSQQTANKDSTPFHEHPRFKELIEEKNKYAEQMRAYERQLQDLNKWKEEMSKPKATQSESPLVQKLKGAGVDDDFVKWVSQQEKLMNEMQQLTQWRQTQESQTAQQRALNTFEKLCIDNKISNEAVKERYLAAVRHEASKNPNLQVEDLPKLFKTIHDAESKFQEDLKRQAIADYTKGKSKDAALPPGAKAVPTGTKAKAPAGKEQTVTDPEQLKAQFAKRVLELARANRNS